ncbi:MAG: hypothetical protein D6768_04580 [Chloroflexi bacterium]|nr:MAG: hypothetical protein D6768_04580 [Chloroflexota bacterium]
MTLQLDYQNYQPPYTAQETNHKMNTPGLIITNLSLLVFGILLVLAGIRLRATRHPAVLHLVIYLGAGFLAFLAHVLTTFDPPPLPGLPYDAIAQLGLNAMVLTFGALSLSFLRKNRAWLTYYWGMTVALLLVWSVLGFNLWSTLATAGTGFNPTLALSQTSWGVAIAVVLGALFSAFRAQPSSKHLNRMRYWLIAVTLHAVAGLVLFISPAIFYQAGTLLLVAGSVLTSYVVLTYHTADLYRLIGTALQFTGITAILAGIFYVGLSATVIFGRQNNNLFNIFFWSVLLAIGLAVITPPLWQYLSRFTGQLIFGRHSQNEKEIVQHFSRVLSSALDMQRLGDILIELMDQTFDIERGAVFVNERGSGPQISLRLLAAKGIDELPGRQFTPDSVLIQHFRQGGKLAHQYDIDMLPAFANLDPGERDWLAGLKMEVFVPIVRYGNVMAVMAFGRRANKSTYHKEDTDLMIALAEQAVLAMDAARLFEQLANISQEVTVLNTELAGLDQNKSDFLSIASHELRTPLTHIHGYSRMLLELTEEEAQDYSYVKTIVAGVVKGSERMKTIIDMMFAITEAHAGDMPLLMGPVKLAEVVRQATGPYLTALDERRIAFATKGLDELPSIEADATRLVQAIENLFSNAIKYTPDGGKVTISGQVTTLEDIGSAVEIVVSDSGIGIDPKHHQKIFDKFFRVDDTDHHSTGKTKFKGAGPGLGLTLVQGIANAHGGKVWVESDGHDEENLPGSRFHFAIPLQPAPILHERSTKQSEIETVHWNKKLVLKQTEKD